MKITVSKNTLMKIFFLMHSEGDNVKYVKLCSTEIGVSQALFCSETRNIKMPVITADALIMSANQSIEQWDNLYLFLKHIEEQPVTLTIEQNILKATFEF